MVQAETTVERRRCQAAGICRDTFSLHERKSGRRTGTSWHQTSDLPVRTRSRSIQRAQISADGKSLSKIHPCNKKITKIPSVFISDMSHIVETMPYLAIIKKLQSDILEFKGNPGVVTGLNDMFLQMDWNTDMYEVPDAVPPIHAVSSHVATDKGPSKFRCIFSDNLQPITTREKKARGTLLVDIGCYSERAPPSVSYYNEISSGHIWRGC